MCKEQALYPNPKPLNRPPKCACETPDLTVTNKIGFERAADQVVAQCRECVATHPYGEAADTTIVPTEISFNAVKNASTGKREDMLLLSDDDGNTWPILLTDKGACKPDIVAFCILAARITANQQPESMGEAARVVGGMLAAVMAHDKS